MGELDRKIVLITGAARGLGKYLAVKFGEEGSNLVICDIDEKELINTRNEIKCRKGSEIVTVRADITNEEDVKNMVDAAVQKFSRIDFFIANAGLSRGGSIHDFDLNLWKKVMDINLFGYFLCVREISKVMIKNRSGAIVQINSRSGKRGNTNNSAYAASKGGGIVLTQSLSAELAEYNIRVNCICPGAIFESDLWKNYLFEFYSERLKITEEEVKKVFLNKIPLKKETTFEDVGNTVMFLLSDKSKDITGQAINVSGGEIVW
jgi:sorbitol-6-phosphate 2-dehydrogenase